jgi:hypothetical protein
VVACNKIEPRGAATMLVPDSHATSRSVVASMNPDFLSPLSGADFQNVLIPLVQPSIDMDGAVEMLLDEGDMLLMDLMIMHTVRPPWQNLRTSMAC